MTPANQNVTTDLLANGQTNRFIGWALLLTGLAAAVVLDPWFLGERSPTELVASARPAVRHAQSVVLQMAFLQLAVGFVLAADAFSIHVRRTAGSLTAAGAIFYAAGYVLGTQWPACTWLVLAGSLLNLGGFLYLIRVGPTGPHASDLKLGLPVVCFGMLLDLVAGLSITHPEYFMPAYLGAEDEVRLRMLRLARVAAVALSVLTLLYLGLARRAGVRRRSTKWGRRGMLCGAIGMPALLAAASYIWLPLKYGLAIPATATCTGILVGVSLSWTNAGFLEKAGWMLILVSLSAGMMMGFYAFDGPLPAPEFLGSYNDFTRRLSRLAHAYCIVLGMIAIFLSRLLEEHPDRRWARWAGIPLLITGSLVTMAAILLQPNPQMPASMLGVGPAIVVIAMLSCLLPIRRRV